MLKWNKYCILVNILTSLGWKEGAIFMENTSQDLMRNIQTKFPRLSKGQKLIAEYILKHYDKAAFMTAAKLGTSVGVSESTVVRFAN